MGDHAIDTYVIKYIEGENSAKMTPKKQHSGPNQKNRIGEIRNKIFGLTQSDGILTSPFTSEEVQNKYM